MKQSLGRRDEKPRTMVASRHGAGSPGGREEREPGGWGARAVAAKHRALPPSRTRGAHGNGARGQRCGMPCRAPRRWRGGAMGTSRPTAMPHERGAHNGTAERGAGGAHGNGTAPRGAGEGARDAHGKWTARRRFNGILPGASPARSTLPLLQVRGRLFRERHVFREPLSTRRQSSALEAYRPFRSSFSRFRLEGPLSG